MPATVQRSRLPLDEAALLEIAHLYCFWRIARGAAHALNNALTAAAGLLDAGGSSKEVEREIDRCVRATRGFTDQHPLRFGRRSEGELVAVVRRVAGLLRDAGSRRLELELALPDEFFHLEADPARVELLLLCALGRLLDASARGGRLRIAVAEGPKPASARVEAELLAADAAGADAEALLDPAAAASVAEAIALEAARRVAEGCGASLGARALPDGGLALCAIFPTVEP